MRNLVQDDPKQALVATRFIEHRVHASQPGFINLVVLVEVCWELRSFYGAAEAEWARSVHDMLAAVQFHIDQRYAVRAVVQKIVSPKPTATGSTDMLVAELARAAGCSRAVTFDKKAVRSAGMQLLA